MRSCVGYWVAASSVTDPSVTVISTWTGPNRVWTMSPVRVAVTVAVAVARV